MGDVSGLREELDKLPTFIYGGPGSRGPTEYVARQDVLSIVGKLEEVAMSGIKAEINRSCTSEQAQAVREALEKHGWVEGVDFIDHTDHGTKCYSQEEMDAFREMLKKRSLLSMKLRPWRQSGLLISTRTCGDIGVAINGSMVDIWIRVNGRPAWFAVDARELKDFLVQWHKDNWYKAHGNQAILRAESDGNAEEDMTGKPIDVRAKPGKEVRPR